MNHYSLLIILVLLASRPWVAKKPQGKAALYLDVQLPHVLQFKVDMSHEEFMDRVKKRWPRISIKLFLGEFEFVYDGEPYMINVEYLSPYHLFINKTYVKGGKGSFVFRLYRRVVGEESIHGTVLHVDGASRPAAEGPVYDNNLGHNEGDIPLRFTCIDLSELPVTDFWEYY
ncbi:MAG: hypothetical protein ACFFER_17890 [Candidatus Thorarchaeota archaeon]